MGKKSSQSSSSSSSIKTPNKHEKKQQIHSNLIKILRPKVYITDSSKFKNLVQELTGNGNGSANANSPASSPPPRINSAASPPPPPPLHAYHENSLDMSFDSSCFSTPLEGSPDLRPLDSFDYGVDFSSQIMDLESLLMGIDSISNAYDDRSDSCYGYGAPIQQEVCVYDYDFSGLI